MQLQERSLLFVGRENCFFFFAKEQRKGSNVQERGGGDLYRYNELCPGEEGRQGTKLGSNTIV